MRATSTLKKTALLLFLVPSTIVDAQNWVVGDPVDMLIYSQTFYGGCTPNPDYLFTLAPSPVSGVAYKAIVTAIDPPTGSLSILPGLTNGVLGSGLVIDTAVERSVLLAPGTNTAVIEFRAMGIPTTAGEAHPCVPSAFWMSNLMFCPEGLIPVIDDNCSVQMSTGLASSGSTDAWVRWPSAANGQQLSIQLPGSGQATVRVLDVSGRIIAQQVVAGHATINLDGVPAGSYVLAMPGPDGRTSGRRFALIH